MYKEAYISVPTIKLNWKIDLIEKSTHQIFFNNWTKLILFLAIKKGKYIYVRIL